MAEAYCSLERDEVRHLHRLLPDVKIIFVLRNPLERVLSAAKIGLALRKARRIQDVPDDEFIGYINHPSSQARSRYSYTLDLWNSCFSGEQFLILFYEELAGSPNAYLSKICSFLGVSFESDYFGDTIGAKLWKSAEEALPAPVLKHAARTFKGEVDDLAARFGGPALEWQQQVAEILG